MPCMVQVVKTLTDEGLTSGAVYKEMFLTLEDTRPLHSEQKVPAFPYWIEGLSRA